MVLLGIQLCSLIRIQEVGDAARLVRATATALLGRAPGVGGYGTAIAYKNTGRAEYINYFKRIAQYFLTHLPDDLCPYWDLGFWEWGKPISRGFFFFGHCLLWLLEMSKYLPQEDAEYYTSLAKRLVAALIRGYQVKNDCVSNGQLLHLCQENTL